MYLKNLSIVNFKNYEQAELDFSPKINCFVGLNGSGKTNLLDAVHYLSFCKSFFNPIDSQNIRHGEEYFVIQGLFFKNEAEENIYCGMKMNQKKQFKRNKKEYSRLADHIGLIPLVMISPEDSFLISEGSEDRRRFVDSVISQYDREYLEDLIIYNRILQHRNKLLKEFANSGTYDEDSLELWNDQLIAPGKKIHEKRKQFIEQLIPVFQKYYEYISSGNESVSLTYQSHLENEDFKTLLSSSLRKDMILQYTTVGTHKDDLIFTVNNFPLKKSGSQGQQKTFLLALKLAQFDFIKNINNLNPLLLLDDIFDKLDAIRVSKLLALVSENHFGQIFITDTNLERTDQIFRL